jgi:hypothetical protein
VRVVVVVQMVAPVLNAINDKTKPMEIKTKYNEDDVIFFLTRDSKYAKGAFNTYLKEGEVFAVEAVVKKINIKVGDGKIHILNNVKAVVCGEWLEIHEDFCAPDIVQLGNDVSNRYRVASTKQKKKKR